VLEKRTIHEECVTMSLATSGLYVNHDKNAREKKVSKDE
jgi:hypothetical protein